MNDFLRHILNELSDAIPLAIITVVMCAVGVGIAYFIFKAKYKTKKFPFANVILWLALVGYVTVVLAVTVLRGEGLRGSNFHLFRAWRESWQLLGRSL